MCFGFGGNLVSIENENEKEFIDNMTSEFKNDGIWIGLVHMSHKGGYLWSDGTPFDSSGDVYSQKPKPCDTSRMLCVEILKNGWNLTHCRVKNHNYICKRPKGKSLKKL